MDSAEPPLSPADPLQLLTVDDLVGLLQVKRSWIYDQVEQQGLPYIRLGRHIRFRRSAIEALLVALEETGRPV